MSEVHPVKEVLLLIGDDHGHRFAHQMPATAKPQHRRKQTHLLHAHETVIDILKTHHEPLDGSVVILNPESGEAFLPWEHPYLHVKFNGRMEVLSAESAKRKAAAALSPAPEPAAPAPAAENKPKEASGDLDQRKAYFDNLRSQASSAPAAELPEPQPEPAE